MQGFPSIVFAKLLGGLLAAALLASPAAAQRAAPQAHAGVIDLSDWDFARDGIVNLAGEWDILWGRFEDATALDAAGAPRAAIAVPSPWNDAALPGKSAGPFGHATYRLKVDCRSRGRLALVLPVQNSAVRLYVNGRVTAVQGSPGGSPEIARPAFVQQITPLEDAACPLEIVAHVSNFDMRNGGLLRSIELGGERQVLERRERGIARDLFASGGLTLLSLMPILFFFWRREDKAPLYLGLYGLSSALFIGLSGERILQPLVAPFGWDAYWKLAFLSLIAGLLAFPAFLRALYPSAFPRPALRVILAVGGAMALLVALTPARVFSYAGPALIYGAAATALLAAAVLLRAAHRGQRGALLMLAGLAVLSATIAWDTAQAAYQIAGKTTPYGLLVFVLAPAVLLARRVARALKSEELRSVEQRQQVDLLVNATKAGIFDADVAAQSTTYSGRLKEMLGHPRDADTTLWPAFIEFIHPEDRERIQASFAKNMRDLSVKGGVRRWRDSPDFRVRKADGTYVWIHGEAISITGADGRTLRHICSFLDISERKQQELELADRIKFTNDLLDSVPLALTLRDTAGRYLIVNRKWEEYFGAGRGEVVGKSVRERAGERMADAVLALDRKVLERGPGAMLQQNDFEYRGRMYTQTRSVMADPRGRVIGVLVASIDTTERAAMERDLESERRRLDLVVRAEQVGIVDWDGRTHATFYSPRFKQILGHAAEADTAGWPDYFKVLIHPEDRERVTARWRAFVTGKSDEGRGNYYSPEEYRLLRADGSYVWVEVAGLAVRDERGFVARWIAAVTDVTAQREQREALARQRDRLQLLLRATKAGFQDWDAVADTRVYSERFKEMLGYPPDADTSLWPSLFDMMHPDDREKQRDAFRDMLRKSASTGERLHGPLEYRLRKADGSYLWVRGEGVAQIGADGRTERFLTSYIDITHLREMNLALEESVRLREEVDRISRHDLKTPLGSIIGIPRLLRDSGRLSSEDGELLGFVEQAGYRLLNMVNLSLDMFRMEQGTYPLTPKAVDLREVLRKVARDVDGHARPRRIALRIEGPQLYALGEELLCYSMFANLVKNAIEASPEGGTVTLTVAAAGNEVRVGVHNAGAVPEAVRARFFDKYSTAGKQGGTGLGTYSARLMARTQRGDIEMQTGASAGTLLSVRLAAAAAPESHSESVSAGQTTAGQHEAAPPRPLSVLVVDDDEYTRVFIGRFLPGTPRLAQAANGREALERTMAELPEVIIMDIDMPVMGGLEAATRIREWERREGRARCAMIAMSSHDGADIRARSLAAGFDRYVEKPVSPEELRRALADCAAARDVILVDPDLKEALPGFLESRREMAAELARAVAAGAAEPVRALAHKLAGSLALYGFHWAAGQGKMIERRARENALAGLADEVAALRRHLDGVTVGFEEKKRAEER